MCIYATGCRNIVYLYKYRNKTKKNLFWYANSSFCKNKLLESKATFVLEHGKYGNSMNKGYLCIIRRRGQTSYIHFRTLIKQNFKLVYDTHFTIINKHFTIISLKLTNIQWIDHHWKVAPTALICSKRIIKYFLL